jgi:hypothetical protein
MAINKTPIDGIIKNLFCSRSRETSLNGKIWTIVIDSDDFQGVLGRLLFPGRFTSTYLHHVTETKKDLRKPYSTEILWLYLKSQK